MGQENTKNSNNIQNRDHIKCSEFHKKKKKINSDILETLNTEEAERENNCTKTLEEESKKLELIIIE